MRSLHEKVSTLEGLYVKRSLHEVFIGGLYMRRSLYECPYTIRPTYDMVSL